MYKIIGANDREYGPVGADELRQWIQEGRANAQSRVRAEGETEWRPLSSFPEFAAALSARPPSVPPPISPAPISVPRSPAQKTNPMAIAGFVCSLLGIPCCLTGLFGVLGLVFSLIGLMQINRDPHFTGKGMAIAGIVISSLMLLASVFYWVCIFMTIFSNANSGRSIFN